MKTILTIIAAASLALSAQAATLDFEFKDNADNEEGFIVERSIDGVNFAQILTLDANMTAFTDPDVPLGETVVYRVYAWNDYGDSGYSNLVTEFTVVPKGPSDFRIKRSNPFARFFKRFNPNRKKKS